MKKCFLLLAIVCLAFSAQSQDLTKFNLYSPSENASEALEKVIEKAKKSGKHVFVQVGGNWCIWCARFNDFVTKDARLDSMIKADYEVYHLNYSKENTNEEILARYKFPQRFGYPVFLILNGKGDLLHTQNSAYLEEEKSYSREKLLEFFTHWAPSAFDPAKYKSQ